MIELIRCERCGQDFEGTSSDVGTYYCDKCYKPTSKLESYSQDDLYKLITKIYYDCLDRKYTIATHMKVKD